MVKRQRLPAGIRDRLPAVANRFRGDPRVVAVYLFGSFARGEEGPLSDLDVALLLRFDIPRQEVADLSAEYYDALCRILGTEEVSFVLLNGVPLAFGYEVVRSGKVLVDNDPDARHAFEVRIEDRFLDFKPVLDAYDEELLRQLAEPSR
jgi:hypothetical protein